MHFRCETYRVNFQTSGDITSTFSPFSATANAELIESSANAYLGSGILQILLTYPGSTQCMETTTTLSSNINPAGLGNAINLTAQVVGTGPIAPTGTVTFRNNASTIGTGTLDLSGLARATTSGLPVGSNSLTAVYNGDALNATSTSLPLWQGVNVSASEISLTSSQNPANVNQSVTITATVTGRSTGAPTGSVTLQDGNTLMSTVNLNSKAIATFAVSLPAGSHALTATYSGDLVNASSTTGPLVQTINVQPTQTDLTSSLNPSDASQMSTFAANVAGEDGATPTGTVTFRFNGNPSIPIVRLQSGEGNINRSFFGAGGRSVTATYSGDKNSQPSTSSTLNQQVNPQPSQISLASSASTVDVGQSVSITATVSGEYGGWATGTVTFFINGVAASTLAVSNDQASYATSFSATGSQNVTATYSGDSSNQSSTSSVLLETVQPQPTTTTLVSSSNPVVHNQTVTFTATVAGQYGAPSTGNVTFAVNGGTVSTVPLTNGQASYSQVFAAAGSDSVSASYSGDSNDHSSSSPTLSQVVN